MEKDGDVLKGTDLNTCQNQDKCSIRKYIEFDVEKFKYHGKLLVQILFELPHKWVDLKMTRSDKLNGIWNRG